MTRIEFLTYIGSIGFKLNSTFFVYLYEGYSIYIDQEDYIFESIRYPINDLKPLNNIFKKELRSIKLKQLLR